MRDREVELIKKAEKVLVSMEKRIDIDYSGLFRGEVLEIIVKALN